MKPNNKIALITGASSGIGLGYAKTLHLRGYKLILVARRESLLRSIADEFNLKRPDSAEILVADLGEAEDLKKVMARCADNPIELLINNAGFGSFGRYEELDLERELHMVDVNISASIALTHSVLKGMKSRNSGSILYVSSIAGFQPLPYMSTYASTKVFMLFHSIALRAELRQFHIKVLAVCPGPTATEFGGVARVPGEMTSIARDDVDQVVEKSLRDLERDCAVSYPSIRAWALSLGPRVLPLRLTTWLTEKMLRGSLPASNLRR